MSKDEFVSRIMAAQAEKRKEVDREYNDYYYDAVSRMKRRKYKPKGVIDVGKSYND